RSMCLTAPSPSFVGGLVVSRLTDSLSRGPARASHRPRRRPDTPLTLLLQLFQPLRRLTRNRTGPDAVPGVSPHLGGMACTSPPCSSPSGAPTRASSSASASHLSRFTRR